MKFESVKRWLTYISAEHFGNEFNTNKVYLRVLEEFCIFVGKNPDELVAERQAQLKSSDEIERRQHEEKTMAFVNHLMNVRKLSPGSTALALAALRSFYKHNYSVLNVQRPRLGWKVRVKRPPTREELSLLFLALDKRKPLYSAIILFMAQTGLAISDTLQVEYRQISDQLSSNTCPVHLSVVRKKTKVQFDTFFGRDTVIALSKYLGTRSSIVPDDKLFPVQDRTVNFFLNRAGYKIGLDFGLSAHCFRKYFVTQLKLAGCNESLVEYWVGHQLSGSKEPYFVPPVEQQREVYRKYEPVLSIRSSVSAVDANKLDEMIASFGGRENLLDLLLRKSN